ncbi:TetR/AcrR family transcriptional regulator [Cohnella luojiensis]|nr:TetR/AcrR family transcriptional regulator [Cohnella luojiensis]
MSPPTTDSLQRLLTATERIIAQKGCQSTTMQDIMSDTGLSKGAIYHYVKSKEELFGLVLQARLEFINKRFYASVSEAGGLHGPLQVIAQGLQESHHPENVMNRILLYLLSQQDKSGISDILKQFNDRFIAASTEWIKLGQQYGVIVSTIDARKTAEHFNVLSYGLRVRNMILGTENLLSGSSKFGDEDYYAIMKTILQGGN